MADARQIEARLAAYLGTTIAGLRVLASGWETTVFEFAIGSPCSRAEQLPIGAPLVLRFYEGSRADDKGVREGATMRRLADAGYPVPRPYLYEGDHAALGAPFLLMERVAGGPLFATHSFPQALKTFSLGFIAFVRVQTMLHRLALERAHSAEARLADRSDDAANPSPLLERILAVIAARGEQGPLPGLREALTRVRERASRFRVEQAVPVHMDYHPQNVIVQGTRVTGVIDWVNADHGDRHLCAATTAAILATSAMERPTWMRENVAGNSLRRLFAGLYIALFQTLAPLEWERFRYCQGVAALLRLSMFGMMRTRGAEAAGFRPQAIENVTPSVVRLLSRYAAKKIGVPVSIEER
jgi:aminoglycoside phosphotransferase (APT) family kinase protein